MKKKHTGGEWSLLRQGKEIQGEGGHEVVTFINGLPVHICEIPVEQVNSESNPNGKDASYYTGKRESLANGRLIAAAPEMARALELIMEVSDKNDYETYRQAVREIAGYVLKKSGRMP